MIHALDLKTPLEAGVILKDAPNKAKVTGYIIAVIGGYRCDARELYELCNAAREAWNIARALDGGTLDDIRHEIISYMYLHLTNDSLNFVGYSRDYLNREINKIDWLNE